MLRSLQFFLSKSVPIKIIFRSVHSSSETSSRLQLVCSLSSRVNNNGSSLYSMKLAIAGLHRWAPSFRRKSPGSTTATTTTVETLDNYPYQTLTNPSSSFCVSFSVMSKGRDRTGEFQTILRQIASRQVSELRDRWSIFIVTHLEWSWSAASTSAQPASDSAVSDWTTWTFHEASEEDWQRSRTDLHTTRTTHTWSVASLRQSCCLNFDCFSCKAIVVIQWQIHGNSRFDLVCQAKHQSYESRNRRTSAGRGVSQCITLIDFIDASLSTCKRLMERSRKTRRHIPVRSSLFYKYDFISSIDAARGKNAVF